MSSKIQSYLAGFELLSEEQQDVYDFCAAHALGMTKKQILKVRASAGTGKTFTANKVIDMLNAFGIPSIKVSFTARAAMRIGGNTLHSLLYEPILDRNGDLIRFEKLPSQAVREKSGQVIIADEWSMNNFEMVGELMAVGLPIIAIGDDHQLDPVDTTGRIFNPFDDVDGYETSLRDMRRFNPDSGIAMIGEALREENVIKKVKSPDVKFVSKALVRKPEFYKKHQVDVIAVGTNKTRREITRAYRIGDNVHDDLPAISERVMCLRNDVINNVRISNGEIFNVMFAGHGKEMGKYMLKSIDDPNKNVTIDILNETWHTEQAPRTYKGQKVGQFTFGRVATVHKLQGSTFDTVLYVDENVSFFTDQRKFRYTGITRAAKNLIVAI